MITVTTKRMGKISTETRVEEAADALAMFESGLAAAGHSDGTIRRRVREWTMHLMGGVHAYEVIDPDLRGSVEISII
ncbi:hypothetical protein PP641_gp072 [Arthrobacter phage SilentRX]|uniref:Uncharacterized protein n=1 Tax=Arthrobacter phage SilentRX TaxID=2836091 RepID=A0A8F3E7Y5_9CAUD|nr:hypothetical protein PP641_gp072 [Arthrobacter phage SilentRX]QWY82812.1 hypothetical protein SEA_SILENTRX_72 [Arthrobacter phage SilentRX]